MNESVTNSSQRNLKSAIKSEMLDLRESPCLNLRDWGQSQMRESCIILAGCAHLWASSVAFAAEPQKPPAPAVKPVVAAPQSTTETYGDWVLICSSAPTGQICEVDSSLSVRGQTSAIARIAFAQPAKDKPLRLVVQTPTNILIAPGVKVESEPGKKGVALVYRSCVPGGCFAEADLSGDQAQAFRGRGEPGQITLTDASGRAVALPISFRGLDSALDALGRK